MQLKYLVLLNTEGDTGGVLYQKFGELTSVLANNVSVSVQKQPPEVFCNFIKKETSIHFFLKEYLRWLLLSVSNNISVLKKYHNAASLEINQTGREFNWKLHPISSLHENLHVLPVYLEFTGPLIPIGRWHLI